MGIVSRFVNVVRAYSNSALDKAEDPELMLNQMITDLETKQRQAKTQVAEALAQQKRLEHSLQKEQEEAKKWEQKAILAVQNAKDDLAKEALVRKKEFDTRAQDLQRQLDVHQRNTDALRDSYQQMEDKIDNLEARAEAMQELSMDSDKDSLEKKFQELEGGSGGDPDIEAQLLALKQQSALPAPDTEKADPEKK
jgi:phage shock protein A